MKKWLKNNQPVFVLAVIGIACFFVYSFLAFSAPKEIFNSPDETANYVFSCGYARDSMGLAEPDNPKVQGMIHPRSATSNIAGNIVPGYFLGMPILLGFIGQYFGCKIIPFIVPIISAITPIFFYFGLKKIFEKEIALISSLLLYFHPIFIYYTAKSLMPNILFIDFLIISLALVLCAQYKKGIKNYFKAQPLIFYFLSGLFLGLALSIRPSEFFWIFFLYLILFLFRIHKINWPGLVLGISAIAIAILPTLILNKDLYGGYFQLGYNTRLLNIDLAQANPASFLTSIFSFSVLFPFGIKIYDSINVFINYFWRFLGWYNLFLIPGLIAFIAYLFEKKKIWSYKLIYLAATLIVSAYLIFYYGGYVFFDHTVANKITIGTSYLRYWMPIFILILPFMAYCLYAIWKLFEKFKINIKASSAILFLMIINFFTFNLIFIETDESLFQVKTNLEKYSKVRQQVLEKTEDNAIIITDRSDKIFFPKRKVVIFLDNYAIFPLVAQIIDHRPVYYYSYRPIDNVEYISERKIKETNLKFIVHEKMNDFYLYKLIRIPE